MNDRINLSELRMYAKTDPEMFDTEVRLALIDAIEAARALFGHDLNDPMNHYRGDPHGLTDELRTLAQSLDRFDFRDPDQEHP